MKQDIEAALAQAELQQDSLGANVNLESLRNLAAVINEHGSEIYDLIGPENYKTLTAFVQTIRLSFLKTDLEQMLQEVKNG